jgi:undecaprenyl-diphosphatase
MLLSLQAALLGIVQGITEFLPISSTGHMILVDEFIHLEESFKETFLVVVQLGSILAVLAYFHARLLPRAALTDPGQRRRTLALWLKAAVGVLPAVLIGALFGNAIKDVLYSSALAVAIALLVGGIVLIIMERRPRPAVVATTDELGYGRALAIGAVQCLALIPGVSRSAATIIGSMFLGTSRSCAVEYSFFLAIPTMLAASAHSLYQGGAALDAREWVATGTGFVAAFIVSWWVIARLMDFIRRRDLQVFGWYRIILGTVLIAIHLWHLYG